MVRVLKRDASIRQVFCVHKQIFIQFGKTIKQFVAHKVCLSGHTIPDFISYLSYQLHCCTLPDKRCLSHGMLPLSGHDDVALFE